MFFISFKRILILISYGLLILCSFWFGEAMGQNIAIAVLFIGAVTVYVGSSGYWLVRVNTKTMR